MHSLVTGMTGFVGGHLAELLLAGGERVSGLSRSDAWPEALGHLAGRVELAACDVSDGPSVARLIAELEPDRIYHLAAQPNVPASFRDPDDTWRVNLRGTRNVLEAVRRAERPARVLVVSSAAVYGDVPVENQPIHETEPPRPTSPYAASKAAAELLVYQYALGFDMDVVGARPFNHTGPRQSPDYVASHFAMQIAEIEQGRREPVLKTGDLGPQRDMSDVRDVVRAYRLLMDAGAPGEIYNVAAGHAVAIRDLLDLLLARSEADIRIEPDPALARGHDASVVVGNAFKLRQATGWAPEYELEQTLADLLDWWRGRDQ